MEGINEFKPGSWSELQDLLFEGSWQPEIQRFRSPYVFRGNQNDAYGLETSLMRLGGNYAELEPHLLRNFRKYARRDQVEHDSIWHWLSLAKHHGLPTRLLDWSFSPLVALHFATSEIGNFEQDGAVWMVNFAEAHRGMPEVLLNQLGAEAAGVFTVEMLEEVVETLADLDQLSENEFVVFFEPPSLDERIVNQYALFSMMSRAGAKLNDWFTVNPRLYRKIIIPAQLKWEVRDKLDQANITERVLFPGLDGLSAWLRRHYSQRGS